jgi:hypothetical protein
MPQIRPIGVSGSIPSVNQLALGDIAINTYDGKAYIKKAIGNTQSIIELGSGGGGSSVSASYALSSSYALNGGVTQLIAGTNVTLSPTDGKGTVTVNAILVSSGSGTPNGPLYSLQYNNGGLFSGSGNFTLLNDNTLYLTGSLKVSGSITGSLFGTASWANNAVNANTASYILNAVSSSFASTASFILLAQSASYVLNAVSASFSDTASYVLNAVSASYSLSSSFATTASFVKLAQSASYVLNAISASFSRTASYINPLSQQVFISGSTSISGSTGIYGDFSVSNATLVDINTSVLNINAPTLQVPSFALAYSPSANIRTVMYDAVSNALFVTSSLPGTGGGGGGNATYIASGSITASVNVDPNSLFLVKSGSIDLLKITTDKVLVLVTQSNSPSAVVGGIYVSSSGDFFFGQ